MREPLSTMAGRCATHLTGRCFHQPTSSSALVVQEFFLQNPNHSHPFAEVSGAGSGFPTPLSSLSGDRDHPEALVPWAVMGLKLHLVATGQQPRSWAGGLEAQGRGVLWWWCPLNCLPQSSEVTVLACSRRQLKVF